MDRLGIDRLLSLARERERERERERATVLTSLARRGPHTNTAPNTAEAQDSIPCGKGELGDRRGRRRTGGFEGTCKEGEDSGQEEGGRHRCRLAGQYNSTAILADT